MPRPSIRMLPHALLRVLPIAMLIQLIILVSAFWAMERMVTSELNDRLDRETRQYAKEVSDRIEALAEAAQAIATNDLVINGLVDIQERSFYIPVFFRSIRMPGPSGAKVTFADYKGRLIAANTTTASYEGRPWLDQVMEGKRFVEISRRGMIIAVPVNFGGLPEGLVIVEHDAIGLSRLLSIPTEAEAVAVFTAAGHVLHSSNLAFARTGAHLAALKDEEWTSVRLPIPDHENLGLITAELESTSFALVDRLQYFLGITLIASLAALVFGTVLTAYTTTKPLKYFIGEIDRFRQAGTFDQRIKPFGTREFHDLTDAFNGMMADLKSVSASRDELALEIEKRELVEARLIKNTNDLKRSNQELEQFAYIASHDLQEPLRKVNSYCEILEEDHGQQLHTDGHQILKVIVDSAKRMQQLIQDLLAYSKITGQQNPTMRLVSTSMIVEAAVQTCDMALKEKAGRIIVGDLPDVSGNATLLHQLFQNLISNSIRYAGDEPPEILIEAIADGENVAFSITDNGIGIEAKYAERVFGIFQRLHDKSSYGGTGIGLAVCKRIVEHHGGNLWLDTTYSNGARFKFMLPIAQRCPQLPQPPQLKPMETADDDSITIAGLQTG